MKFIPRLSRTKRYMRVKALVAEFPEGAEKEAKKCLFDLGQSLVVAHREIDERCTHLAYLFSEYEPRCGYFECVECFRRIALTGFMVLYDDDSAADAGEPRFPGRDECAVSTPSRPSRMPATSASWSLFAQAWRRG